MVIWGNVKTVLKKTLEKIREQKNLEIGNASETVLKKEEITYLRHLKIGERIIPKNITPTLS